MQLHIEINGVSHQSDQAPGLPLHDLLRALGLTRSPLVILDGRVIDSQLCLAMQAQGRRLVTLEALAAFPADLPHPAWRLQLECSVDPREFVGLPGSESMSLEDVTALLGQLPSPALH